MSIIVYSILAVLELIFSVALLAVGEITEGLWGLLVMAFILTQLASEISRTKSDHIESIPVMRDVGVRLPRKAHKEDAGFDLKAVDTKKVPARGSAVFDTGVHVAIPDGYVGFLKSKSGLNVNHGITSEGVIDCGYTGSIMVKLYNHSDEDYEVLAGDKITQLVLLPILQAEMKPVSKLDKTDRGNGGFGSSGK